MMAGPRRRAGQIARVSQPPSHSLYSPSPPSTEDASLVGAVIDDRYELVELVGVGRSGLTFRAQHLRTHRPLRVRVLPSDEGQQDIALDRLERQVAAAGILTHPAVVSVVDLGRLEDDRPYLVLEQIDGRPLSEAMRSGPLPVGRVIDVARQLADALVAVHAAGVVHRDLSPGSVLLTAPGARSEQVRLVGFGDAMVPRSTSRSDAWLGGMGLTRGRDGFRAPELGLGGTAEVDARADLWALGALIYSMLTGEVLRSGAPSAADQAARRLGSTCPEPLVSLVESLLSAAPASRPSSALEVFERLDLLLEGGGAPGRAPASSAPLPAPAPAPALPPVPALPAIAAPLVALAEPVELAGAVEPVAVEEDVPAAEPVAVEEGAPAVAPSAAPAAGGSMRPPGAVVGIAALGAATAKPRGPLTELPAKLRELVAQLERRVGRRGLLMAGAGLLLLAVIVVVVVALSGSAEQQEQVASSASASPEAEEEPDSTPAEIAALFAEARQGKKDALAKLEAKKEDDPSGQAFVVLAQGKRAAGDPKGALDALSRLLRDKPALAADQVLLDELRALSKVQHLAPLALDLMASMPGPQGPDLLFDLWAGTSERTPTTSRAKELLGREDVKRKRSAALEIAVDLRQRRGEGCEVLSKLVERAVSEADSRAVRPLLIMQSKEGCGRGGDGDCFPCLRGDDTLERATKAATERKAPGYVASLLPTG